MNEPSNLHAVPASAVRWLGIGLLCFAAIGPVNASAQGRRRTPASPPSTEQPAATDTQSLIAPGVYSFQTRLDLSSCTARIQSGSVRTYVAMVNGVPGSRQLSMRLLGTQFWSTWTLHITEEGIVVGDAQQDGVEGPARGDSHFELRVEGTRFSGRGSRSYTQRQGGELQRCRVSYDALFEPLTQ